MNDNNYLNNEDLLQELKISIKNNKVTEKLHLMFYTLATNIATKPNFRNYSYKQDMIQNGYIKCVEKYNKFDITKFNPFSYFSQVIMNTFIDTIKREHREFEGKQELYNEYQEIKNYKYPTNKYIKKLVGNK